MFVRERFKFGEVDVLRRTQRTKFVKCKESAELVCAEHFDVESGQYRNYDPACRYCNSPYHGTCILFTSLGEGAFSKRVAGDEEEDYEEGVGDGGELLGLFGRRSTRRSRYFVGRSPGAGRSVDTSARLDLESNRKEESMQHATLASLALEGVGVRKGTRRPEGLMRPIGTTRSSRWDEPNEPQPPQPHTASVAVL
jgi:hypothetical protein